MFAFAALNPLVSAELDSLLSAVDDEYGKQIDPKGAEVTLSDIHTV